MKRIGKSKKEPGRPRQGARAGDRAATRFDTLFSCRVTRERDQEEIARVAWDFSATGVQVLTDARVLTGEPVALHFDAPLTGHTLTLRGTVARVLHGRRPRDWGRRLGVAFDEPSGSERRLLDTTSRALAALR